jgi:hypothetical protein
VTQARGKTRDIDFTTSEGTWMSADLSPDRSWTPDGNFIVVKKSGRGGGEGGAPPGGIWVYHKDGGQGVQLVGPPAGGGGGGGGGGQPNAAPGWPTISGDGRYLYYQVTMPVDDRQPCSTSGVDRVINASGKTIGPRLRRHARASLS